MVKCMLKKCQRIVQDTLDNKQKNLVNQRNIKHMLKTRKITKKINITKRQITLKGT